MKDLQSLSSVPAVIALTNIDDVKKQIFTFSKSKSEVFTDSESISKLLLEYYEEWKHSLKGVITDTLKLFNPVMKSIIPKHLVPLIGIEMLKWAKFIESEFGLERNFIMGFISCSIFTPEGLIDEVKAARELVKEQNLSSFTRYKISCYYFLEDIIPSLWQEIRDSELDIKDILQKIDLKDPVRIWSQYLEGKDLSSTAVTDQSYMKYFLPVVLCSAILKDNSEAVKFYFRSIKLFSNYETEDFPFSNHLGLVAEVYFSSRSFPHNFLLSRKFGVYRNILLFLLEEKEQRIMEYILGQSDVYCTLLEGLLFYPFQNLFMKTIVSIFHYKLSEDVFYLLLHNIIDLICDEDLGQTYDYRILFREFWCESPTDLKNYVLHVESGFKEIDFSLLNTARKFNCKSKKQFLLSKILLLNKFTLVDENNFCLILKGLCPEEKLILLRHQTASYEDLFVELFKLGTFKPADVFVNNLISSEGRKNFKKYVLFQYFLSLVLCEENLELGEKLVNWVADPDEVESLKKEIFNTELDLTKLACAYLFRDISLTTIDNLLLWFLHSDDKISEFKKNGEFPPFSLEDLCEFPNDDIGKLDKYFKWLEYSSDKIILTKKKILRNCFPHICELLYTKKIDRYRPGILYVCSYDKKMVKEFTTDLQVWWIQKIKENLCIHCGYNTKNSKVIFDDSTLRFYCTLFRHCVGPLSKKTAHICCSKFLKNLYNLIDIF